jgi:hypothetical protein
MFLRNLARLHMFKSLEMGNIAATSIVTFLVLILSPLAFGENSPDGDKTVRPLLNYSPTPVTQPRVHLAWSNSTHLRSQDSSSHTLPPLLYAIPSNFSSNLNNGSLYKASVFDRALLGAFKNLQSKNLKREKIKKDLQINDAELDAATPLVTTDKSHYIHLSPLEFVKLQKVFYFRISDLLIIGPDDAVVLAGELYKSNTQLAKPEEWQNLISEIKYALVGNGEKKDKLRQIIGLKTALQLPLNKNDRFLFVKELESVATYLFSSPFPADANIEAVKIMIEGLAAEEKSVVLRPLIGGSVGVEKSAILLKVWRLYDDGPEKKVVAKWLLESFLNGNPGFNVLANGKAGPFLLELLESVPDSSLIAILNAYNKRGELFPEYPMSNFERALAHRLNKAMLGSIHTDMWISVLGSFKLNSKRTAVFMPYLAEGFQRGSADKERQENYKASLFYGIADVIQYKREEKYLWAIRSVESLRAQMPSSDFYEFLSDLKTFLDSQPSLARELDQAATNSNDPYVYIIRHLAFGRCGKFMREVNSQRPLASILQ